MSDRAFHWQIVRGIALIITGFFAGAGAATVCALRNLASYGATEPLGHNTPISSYLVITAFMVVWFVIACTFAWRNKNTSGYFFSGVAFTVFALSVFNVLNTAYPACNAF
jgi:hypothetical protein